MMRDGERRKLVFSNLANGIPVPRVMETFQLSEKEVMADFAFVAAKIRSYRFERSQPPLDVSTIVLARNRRIEALLTMARINAETDPTFSRIETLPYTPDGGTGMSLAEQKMLEMRQRAGGTSRG